MIGSEPKYINIHSHTIDSENNVLCLNILPNEPSKLNQISNVFYSSGLHPWYLEESESQLSYLEEILTQEKVIAVGECGLDPFSKFPMEQQEEIFRIQVELSEKYQKPMLIHCVKAYNEMIKIRKQLNPTMPWILHGFNANTEITKECIRQGFYFSIGHRVMDSTSNLVRVIQTIPSAKLFFETDESTSSISAIYNQYGILIGMEVEAIQELVTENFNAIFT